LSRGDRPEPRAVHRDRVPRLELDLDGHRHVGRRLRVVRELEHLRRRLDPRILEDPALVGDVEQVPVGAVGPLGCDRNRDVVASGEFDQGRPGIELPLAPGCEYPEVGRERRVGQLEADLVVALPGCAVGHRVRALPGGDLDLRAGDQRPRDRGAEEVGALVDRVRAEHREDEVAHELLAEIHDVNGRGPGAERLLADRHELLALAEVGAEGDHVAAVALDQPPQDHRGVEPARVREDDALRLRRHRPSLRAG
jgi:hypothetical protein